MTNWTTPQPIVGVSVQFKTLDTETGTNWTGNWTASERELDSELDTPEPDTLHARTGHALRYCAPHWAAVLALYRGGMAARRILVVIPPCRECLP
jgi:hypothetical protein